MQEHFLARKVQLHWLDAPYSEAASLSCLIHMPADISISAFSCVLSFGSAAVKFCAQSVPSERESANGGRTGGAAYDDGLVAPVRLHRGDRPSVQADLVLLHRIHSLRNTAGNSQTPLSGEAQAGRGVLVSVFQQQGVPKQTPGPIRHPTKTTGCPTILAAGLGLTPPGSLSRMRSLQPFSSQ